MSQYLPAQMSDEELEEKVKKIMVENQNLPNPGMLIGICIKALAGQADNGRIAQMVKKLS